MALTAQMVTIDCADPASLAKVWAEAAGCFAWTVLTDPEGNEFFVSGRE